jgi:hypothetical protein
MNDEEIKEEFGKIWISIEEIKRKIESNPASIQIMENKGDYIFENKNLSHSDLLEELLKSNFCHSRNGLTYEEILNAFKENGRPVVPKKVNDLLCVWKQRRKIDGIKIKGEKVRYFWIENEKPNRSN